MSISDRTDVFPDDAIFDILAANPDELKEDTLISFLENKEDPLPDYMISILQQLALTNTTYKAVLLNEMAHYYSSKIQAAKSIVHSILADSIVDQVDFRNWLDNMENIEADKQIIASFLTENDTTNALGLLNILPVLYELDGNELDKFNNYKDLLLVQLGWKYQGKTIFNLDSTDISLLAYYADSTTADASYSAKNILSFAYGYDYCECLSFTDSLYFKSANAFADHAIRKNALSIIASPNPASTWVAFDYKLVFDKSEGLIRIFDINGRDIKTFEVTGKQGQQLWDTRSVIPGVYIYTISTNGFSKSGKVIIK